MASILSNFVQRALARSAGSLSSDCSVLLWKDGFGVTTILIVYHSVKMGNSYPHVYEDLPSHKIAYQVPLEFIPS